MYSYYNPNPIKNKRVGDCVVRALSKATGKSWEETPKNAPKTHECTCGDKFATKEQINALEGKINDLTAKYEELSKPIIEKPKTTSKKAKESEE